MTLKEIELQPGESLLDIGCGTGRTLEALKNRFPNAVFAGVEPTQEMLQVATSRLPDSIDLKQNWAESLPFDASTFDVVVSCSMFHYIRKPVVALAEVMRVLKPGGRVVITDWCDDYLACRLYDLVLGVFNRAHFKVYKKSECYDFLNLSGFGEIKISSYKINWFWGLMTATACKLNMGVECIEERVK